MRIALYDAAPIYWPYRYRRTGAHGLLFRARVERRLVGYATLEHGQGKGPAIGAAALSVLRLYRHKGIGERLMRAPLAVVSEEAEITEVRLSVQTGKLAGTAVIRKARFRLSCGCTIEPLRARHYLAML